VLDIGHGHMPLERRAHVPVKTRTSARIFGAMRWL
jgi:hypothetical protein